MSDISINYPLIPENFLGISHKKENGIYYTDESLTDMIVSELDIDVNSVVLDPCCGSANFLLSCKKHGIKKLYGIDIDFNTIKSLSHDLCKIKFFNFDSIFNSHEYVKNKLNIANVDYIIGNPPYIAFNNSSIFKKYDKDFIKQIKKYGANSFAIAFIRALEIVKEGGIVSYILPKNFLYVSSYKKLREKILNEKTIISIIDIKSYFKDVRGEQIIITVKNSKASTNIIKIKEYCENKFINRYEIVQSFYSDEIILFNNKYEFSLYEKLRVSYKTLSNVCSGYAGRGKSKSINAIKGRDIRKFGYKNINTKLYGNSIFIQNIYSAEAGIIAAIGCNFEASETITVFTDGNENMCRYLLGILHSNLINFFLLKFCYNGSKLTLHTDVKYIKKIPLHIKDKNSFNNLTKIVKKIELENYMSNNWFYLLENLNSLVYDIYGIDNTEIASIEKYLKSMQSKKWFNNDKKM